MRSRLLGITLIAVLTAPVVLGSVRTSGRIIVPEGEVVTEDLYGIGDLVIIEGTIEGDLFAVASEIRIPGLVTGDVMGLVGGPVTISGQVGGAVRVASLDLDVTGTVGDDVAALAATTTVSGPVGRDLLVFGGEIDVEGRIGRDVRLQGLRLAIDGHVERDVLVQVDSLRLEDGASVSGDVLYTAADDAVVADGATVDGHFIRRTTISPIWAKAVTRLVSILSFFALVVAGLIGGWLFRRAGTRSVDMVEQRPWRSAAVGTAVLLGLPLLAATLFLTLIGIPVAILVLVAWIAALVLGPIPAVTRLGSVLLAGRGGLAAGLVVGALVWRLAMWALPLVAGFLYLAALVVGLGSFATAGWSLRREPPM